MYHQHLLQRDLSQADPAEDCVDKAVHQLVAIGFTAVQAREALRRTTTRDGLRVDWAVELLLREI
jgi:Holliday junction resolvasome RuvABC DNA-binding subunit